MALEVSELYCRRLVEPMCENGFHPGGLLVCHVESCVHERNGPVSGSDITVPVECVSVAKNALMVRREDDALSLFEGHSSVECRKSDSR